MGRHSRHRRRRARRSDIARARLSVRLSEVARRHDVFPNLVFTWRRQARQARLGGVTEVSSLLPVMIQAEKPPVVNESDLGARQG
ncbi:transposase [Labrys portucalensis]|uniref:Transposase n=1 Tax=Labrys neptuniae TaxID=376174 RepID=A0ABV6ZN46_9HYPH